MISIGGKVTDISDIHHMLERISHDISDGISQSISKKICPHIADVRISIDCWSARIYPDEVFFRSFVGRIFHQGNKFFLAASERIVDVKFHILDVKNKAHYM